MSQTGYIILAIAVVAILAAVFFVSFLAYVKTPVPKGCENLGRDESKCSGCDEAACRFYKISHSDDHTKGE